MRIAYISAGAGDMYCGACAHDLHLARALRARGHDAVLVPVYTPLKSPSDEPVESTRVFYGCINVATQPIASMLRRVMPFVHALLDHERLLRFVSGAGAATDPGELGPLTVSVLQGEAGLQREHLDVLMRFLRAELRPDVVLITNALLSALAPPVKRRLGVPVLCGLQGEDAFVRAFPQPYERHARALMTRNAQAVDLFVTPAEFYVGRMARFLSLRSERIRVCRAAVDLEAFRCTEPRGRSPFVIGYLSRLAESKGVDTLVEAFILLGRHEKRDVRLQLAGKVAERGFAERLFARIAAGGLQERFEYLGELAFAAKVAFLRDCSAFVMPCRYPMIRGLSVLEALSAGVPVVASRLGVYPQIISDTGGGRLVPPEDPKALAQELAWLMDHPEEADAMGRGAREAVAERYSAKAVAQRLEELIEEVRADKD